MISSFNEEKRRDYSISGVSNIYDGYFFAKTANG